MRWLSYWYCIHLIINHLKTFSCIIDCGSLDANQTEKTSSKKRCYDLINTHSPCKHYDWHQTTWLFGSKKHQKTLAWPIFIRMAWWKTLKLTALLHQFQLMVSIISMAIQNLSTQISTNILWCLLKLFARKHSITISVQRSEQLIHLPSAQRMFCGTLHWSPQVQKLSGTAICSCSSKMVFNKMNKSCSICSSVETAVSFLTVKQNKSGATKHPKAPQDDRYQSWVKGTQKWRTNCFFSQTNSFFFFFPVVIYIMFFVYSQDDHIYEKHIPQWWFTNHGR